MESKTKNRKSVEEIRCMVERGFTGLTIAEGQDAVEELTSGCYNAAYNVKLSDGREVILKIAPPKDAEILFYEKNIMHTEAEAMRLVKENTDVLLPEIYFYDDKKDICDVDYFFMEKLYGDNYALVKGNMDPEATEKIDFQIGQMVNKMNGITGTYFGYPGRESLQADNWKEAFLKMLHSVIKDGKKKNADIKMPYEDVEALVMSRVNYLEDLKTSQFVHWDIWDGNVFVKDGSVVGLIDFERALWGDPLMEVNFRSLELEATPALRGYGKTEFIRSERVRSVLYSVYLYLIMIIECYYRQYGTDGQYNYSVNKLAENVQWLKKE